MTALGAVQQRGHLAIDDIYGPLSLAVEAAVVRRAVPAGNGESTLTPSVVPFIVSDIGRLIDTARPIVFAAITPILRMASDAAQPAADPLPSLETNLIMLPATRRTAAALQTDRAGVLRQTGAVLLGGIRRGLRTAAIAKAAQQYFSPFFSPRRDSGGTMRRDQREGAVTSWPGQSGMASQHPRLVMLTESSAVYNGTMMAVAERDDELLRYTLSLKHLERDLCDEWAQVNVGYGPGVYPADEAPPIPNHPRCRCYFESAGKRPTFPEEQYERTGKRRAFPLAQRR